MKKTFNLIFALIYLSLLVLFFLMRNPELANTFGVLYTVVFSILILLVGIMAIKAYGLKNVHGRAVLLLVVGFFAKMVWGFLFMGSIFIGTPLPLFSPYNLIAVLAYGSLFSALVIEIRHCKIAWTTNKILTNAGLTIGLVLVVMYLGIIKPGLLTSDLTAAMSNFGDLLIGVLTILIFAIVREYKGGKMAKAWTFVMFSFLVGIFTNVLVTNFSVPYFANEWPYRNLDYIWYISHLLMVQGFFQMKVIVDDISASLLKKQD